MKEYIDTFTYYYDNKGNRYDSFNENVTITIVAEYGINQSDIDKQKRLHPKIDWLIQEDLQELIPVFDEFGNDLNLVEPNGIN